MVARRFVAAPVAVHIDEIEDWLVGEAGVALGKLQPELTLLEDVRFCPPPLFPNNPAIRPSPTTTPRPSEI
jgi:hypothetical protein